MYIVLNNENVMWQDAFEKVLYVSRIGSLFYTRGQAQYAIRKTTKERRLQGFEDRYSDINCYKIIRLE